MPTIGKPDFLSPQRRQDVSIAPKRLGKRKEKSQKEIDEDIINRATGQRPESIHKDGPHNQMGKDEFLKLLTFQLQNQDPMNPVDQQKMTGELAQFSQLEQLSNLNTKFDQINKNKMIQDKYFAASFVGKEVVTNGSSIKLDKDGEPSDVLFKLDGEADKVVIRIHDNKNQIVGEIWKEGMSGGAHSITWDGIMLDGQLAAKGNYNAHVKAWDATGGVVQAKTQATGMVQSVSFEDGEPVLVVDNQKVYLRDVSSFHQPGKSKSNLPSAKSLQSDLQSKVSPKNVSDTYQDQYRGIYD